MAAPRTSTEQEILDSLLKAYPAFLSEELTWAPGPEPPDFIGTSTRGERFGLELTEWLNEDQTTVSISNEKSRNALLSAIDSEHRERPRPLIRILICDRLNVKFERQDNSEYVREIYQLAEDYAHRLDLNEPFGIWPVQDLAAYPTLKRYCVAVTLYGPPYIDTTPSGDQPYGAGKRWIDFEPVGGAYDPQWSVNALQSRILTKAGKYAGIHRDHGLQHFALLIHYGIRGLLYNTPYRGRDAGLDNVVVQAHKCLSLDHGAFDSVYLYMAFNDGKLIALFPELRVLKEYAH